MALQPSTLQRARSPWGTLREQHATQLAFLQHKSQARVEEDRRLHAELNFLRDRVVELEAETDELRAENTDLRRQLGAAERSSTASTATLATCDAEVYATQRGTLPSIEEDFPGWDSWGTSSAWTLFRAAQAAERDGMPGPGALSCSVMSNFIPHTASTGRAASKHRRCSSAPAQHVAQPAVAKPAGRSWRSWLWPFRAEGPDGGEAIEAVYSKPWCDIDIPQQENVPPAVGCGNDVTQQENVPPALGCGVNAMQQKK